MKHFFATPHQYGAEIQIRDEEDFRKAYQGQADSVNVFVVSPPSAKTLTEWAKSCLSLSPYAHPCGGWSPFRSAEIQARREDKTERFFYKLGDNNCS